VQLALGLEEPQDLRLRHRHVDVEELGDVELVDPFSKFLEHGENVLGGPVRLAVVGHRQILCHNRSICANRSAPWIGT
jgi:hypothetical protein